VTSTGARTRAVAAEVIDAVVTHGKSLDAAIAAHESRLPPVERPMLRMLCFGVLRNHWRLQEWIGQLLNRPLKKRDSVINALLAIGLFQLTDTRVPEHAAVSLTVDAARALRRPKLAGLLNACLRRFQREDLAGKAPASDEARWNHPRWLIDALRHDWPDDCERILEANNARAPMWLRVNAARLSAAEYRERLADVGIEAELFDAVPDAVRLLEPRPVDDLPGFAAGDASVQDAAAQIAARWLMRDAPARVLDACAAPGGKSGHLAELGSSDFELTAVDSDADRLERVRETHARLGLDATIVLGDASKPGEWWDGRPFDAILLDAPCSATGVIRRHPDIKLLRRAGDIDELGALQKDILGALWPLLAPGGRLLYVTCSVLARENDGVVQGFLEDSDDAVEDTVLPNYNNRDLMRRTTCGYQVLPGTAGMDGFYYACLVRKTSQE
jgi:16S rRNA (cytosine967-C5)-methyltransferase